MKGTSKEYDKDERTKAVERQRNRRVVDTDSIVKCTAKLFTSIICSRRKTRHYRLYTSEKESKKSNMKAERNFLEGCKS